MTSIIFCLANYSLHKHIFIHSCELCPRTGLFIYKTSVKLIFEILNFRYWQYSKTPFLISYSITKFYVATQMTQEQGYGLKLNCVCKKCRLNFRNPKMLPEKISKFRILQLWRIKWRVETQHLNCKTVTRRGPFKLQRKKILPPPPHPLPLKSFNKSFKFPK